MCLDNLFNYKLVTSNKSDAEWTWLGKCLLRNGEAIKHVKKIKKLTQSELAVELWGHPDARNEISRMVKDTVEAGHCRPVLSPTEIIKLAQISEGACNVFDWIKLGGKNLISIANKHGNISEWMVNRALPLAVVVQAARSMGDYIQKEFSERKRRLNNEIISTEKESIKLAEKIVTESGISTANGTPIKVVRARDPQFSQYFEIESIAPDISEDDIDDLILVTSPVEGRRNLARGLDTWVIDSTIGIYKGDNKIVPIASAIYRPATLELFAAINEDLSFLQIGDPKVPSSFKERELEPTKVKKIETSLIAFHISSKGGRNSDEMLATMNSLANESERVESIGCGPLAMALISDGRIEAFLNHSTSPWSVIAGSILIKASGGFVSSYCRNPQTWENNCSSVLAAGNKFIHDELRDLIFP